MIIFRAVLAGILGAILSLFAVAFDAPVIAVGGVIAAFSYLLGYLNK